MAKNTYNISIENLTINVAAPGQRTSAPSDLLGKLIGDALDKIKAEGNAKDETKAGDEDATVKEISADDIVEFVRSSETGKRSIQEIAEFMGMPERIAMLPLAILCGKGMLVDDEDEANDTVVFSLPKAEGQGDTEAAPEAMKSDESNAPAETPALNSVNVLAFLRSDPRYTLRTAEAVSKHFGAGWGYEFIQDYLNDLVNEGTLVRKTRRGTGVYLYGAAEMVAPVETAAEETTNPVLDYDNVLAFLRSDARYTKRTFESIVKRFDHVASNRVEQVLDDMENDGLVNTFRRRSDGATLYAAA